MTTTDQIRVTLMRGGTSKGVFRDRGVLPVRREERDAFLLERVDVEYLFVQVGVADRIVDTAGNCGNLTPAVAAYAVDHGLVEAVTRVTTVRMRNVNIRPVPDECRVGDDAWRVRAAGSRPPRRLPGVLRLGSRPAANSAGIPLRGDEGRPGDADHGTSCVRSGPPARR